MNTVFFHFNDSFLIIFTESDADWQDRISTSLDRLAAFASTELDKRRRSTEGVNTSPDSGLGSDSSAILGPPATIPSPDEPLGTPRTPSPGSPRPTLGHHNHILHQRPHGVQPKYQRNNHHTSNADIHHYKKQFLARPKGKEWNWNHDWPGRSPSEQT